MLNPQTLSVEEVPWLVPDDGNDDSYDTLVELSFFDCSPAARPIPREQYQACDTLAATTGRSRVDHVPIRPLDLKRRQYSTGADQRFPSSAILPTANRSVSDNVIPQARHTRPPPRASVTPRSPSILTRSSNSHFEDSQLSHLSHTSAPSNGHQACPGNYVASMQPAKQPFTNRIPSMGPSSRLPLRSTSAPPPTYLSPTDQHLGLDRYIEDIQYLGFSPASLGSPSDSDSGMSRDYHVGDNWVEVDVPMTPSRAGAKALQVLGAANTTGKNAFKKTRKDCYRPVPSTVIRELDAFFGFPSSSSKPATHSGLKAKSAPRSIMASITDSNGRVWDDETEREEFSALLSETQLEQRHIRGLDRSRDMILLSPIRLHSKQSMDALRNWRDSHETDSDEDVFGRLAPLPKTTQGISVVSNRTRERIIYSRQQSHPPPSTMSFLQSDPYAGTQRRHTSPRTQSAAIKRKEPPPPLTLDQRSPSAVKQVTVEQIVSGRPRLPSTQVPVRKSSKTPALVRSVSDVPFTPFSAPRPAPAPPGAPIAPRRIPTDPFSDVRHYARQGASPTPRTPSPEQSSVPEFLTRIHSNPDDHAEERPMLHQGMSFFEDSPSPDHTHFRLAPSKATMRDVSGRIRKAVRL